MIFSNIPYVNVMLQFPTDQGYVGQKVGYVFAWVKYISGIKLLQISQEKWREMLPFHNHSECFPRI